MLRKIKTFLGIEGIRLEVNVPESVSLQAAQVDGIVECRTLHKQTLQYVVIQLVEIYTRGRRSNKRIDEYILGEKRISVDTIVEANEVVDIPFTLDFSRQDSPIERWQQKNPANKGLGAAAKWLHNAHSSYYIKVHASAEGSALSPFVQVEIKLTS